MNRFELAHCFFAALVAVGFCGCASHAPVVSSAGVEAAGPPVRSLDFSQTPDLKELAGQARQLGDEFYPKVCALLGDSGFRPPQRFDIIIENRLKWGDVAVTRGATIYLNGDWFRNGLSERGEKPGYLDKVLVHEMAHVALQHKPSRGAARYWSEGMADFVRYRLGLTNGWNCPECSSAYPHYTSGYCCAGAFLMQLDTLYGSNLVRQLNAGLRTASYSEQVFSDVTGKSLETLWAEFQKTPAFKPGAETAFKVQQSLGYVNGKPPRNIDARWEAYVNQQPGGALTLEGRQFLEGLRKNGRLPGFQKRERLGLYQGEFGNVSYELPRGADPAFPAWREFHFHKSDADPSVYRYLIVRTTKDSPWKLQKAWRTLDAQVIEEFAVP